MYSDHEIAHRLGRAKQLANETWDGVYLVCRHEDKEDCIVFEVTLRVPGGRKAFVAVSSTNSWVVREAI